jgi:hypothetical protein
MSEGNTIIAQFQEAFRQAYCVCKATKEIGKRSSDFDAALALSSADQLEPLQLSAEIVDLWSTHQFPSLSS